MYILNLTDEQLCAFVEEDIKKSESERAYRGDGYALDLMADMFASDHSRDDKHYLYEINKINRTATYIDVKGYSTRVRCPGQYRRGNSAVTSGNFIYRFSDTKIDKLGNILWHGRETSDYIRFVLANLPEEEKEGFKRFYARTVAEEMTSLIND